MRVVVLPAAVGDLLSITSYIAAENAPAAERMARELFAKCTDLGDTARRGQVVARRSGREIRRLVHGDFLIVYTIDGDAVHVRRIGTAREALASC